MPVEPEYSNVNLPVSKDSTGQVIVPFCDGLNLEEQQIDDDASLSVSNQHLPPIRPPSVPPPPVPGQNNQIYFQPAHIPPERLVSNVNRTPHYATPTVRYQVTQSDAEPFIPTYQGAQFFHTDFGSAQHVPTRTSGVHYVGSGFNRESRHHDRRTTEPVEAIVSRPLAIIALFCCCQLWFSVPAMILACRRRRSRSSYQCSINLSLLAIVLGICLLSAFVLYVIIALHPSKFQAAVIKLSESPTGSNSTSESI